MSSETYSPQEQAPSNVDELCRALSDAASDLDRSSRWPEKQMHWCAEAGVFRWFIPEQYGGWGWSEKQILDGYLMLSGSCLTTTFVLTQWSAACRRILASDNESLKQSLLPKLASGDVFATVGISHLSTSRQHLSQPVLRAIPQHGGNWILDGYSPWVTGAAAADVIVMGATQVDGRQILCAVPTDRHGVSPQPGQDLVALTASCTDQVELSQVEVLDEELLAGPVANVMQASGTGGTGGLQTSTLAIGLSKAAVNYLREQCEQRSELKPILEKLQSDVQELEHALYQLADGNSIISAADLRQRANSAALRTTQAALTAAKGSGFLAGSPIGRMAREALFFLVWSCPQPVANANLCELAQLA